jgi:N-methylhydantoinase A
VISVARGHDPRRFALVAFGGAGPLHACAIADELDIRRVVVPRYPGVTSALGLLLADVQHDLRLSWVRATDRLKAAQLNAHLDAMGKQARELLAGAGYADGRGRVEVAVDMRYRGQAYELTIPLRAARADAGVLAAMDQDFHTAHRRAYGHAKPVEETEVVTLRVRGVGRVPVDLDLEGAPEGGSRSGKASRRRVWLGGRSLECSVYERDLLREGAKLTGPAIIEQDDSTLLVEPGWRLRVAEAGNAILERR